MIPVHVRVTGRGVVLVDDKWTEAAIENDPDGFDSAVEYALPRAIKEGNVEVEVQGAVIE